MGAMTPPMQFPMPPGNKSSQPAKKKKRPPMNIEYAFPQTPTKIPKPSGPPTDSDSVGGNTLG